MKIKHKLLYFSGFVALISVAVTSIVISYIAMYLSMDSMEYEARNKLIMLREIKKDQIESYLKNIQRQIIAISDEDTIINSMKNLQPAYATYMAEVSKTIPEDYKQKVVAFYRTTFVDKYRTQNGGDSIDTEFITNSLSDTSYALQYNYIVQDQDNLNDNSNYTILHKKYNSKLQKIADELGFYDIMLVDNSGSIVFNLSKEIDFAASVNNTMLENSSLARVFDLAKRADFNDFVTISDFSAYIPSYNNQAAFIASPIYSDGVKIGVIICELSIEKINNIMTNNNQWEEIGLGKTGETILVGEDYKLRSTGRFFQEDPEKFINRLHAIGIDEKILHIMKARKTDLGIQTVDMEAAKEAIVGQKGYNIFYGYRKTPVLAAYDQLHISGINWAIIAKIDQSEALVGAYLLQHKIWVYTVITLAVILILVLILSYILATQISSKIEILSKVLGKISQTKDLTKRVKIISKDELGYMAYSVNQLLDSLQELVKETLSSTTMFYSAADKLKNASIPYKNPQDLKSLKETGDNLEVMTARLESLSKKFKFIENEQNKTSDW